MIAAEKHQNALRSLQAVITHGRTMALRGDSLKTIADLMDAAEYLPFLIARPVDETQRFRRALVDIAAKFQCPYVVQLFDNPVEQGWRGTDSSAGEQGRPES